MGSALGAALGGALAEGLGWRWEFGIQIPPLLVCCGVSLVAIPADIGVQEGKKSMWTAIREFDAKGSLLLTSAITFLILGLVSEIYLHVDRNVKLTVDCRTSAAMFCHVSALN